MIAKKPTEISKVLSDSTFWANRLKKRYLAVLELRDDVNLNYPNTERAGNGDGQQRDGRAKRENSGASGVTTLIVETAVSGVTTRGVTTVTAMEERASKRRRVADSAASGEAARRSDNTNRGGRQESHVEDRQESNEHHDPTKNKVTVDERIRELLRVVVNQDAERTNVVELEVNANGKQLSLRETLGESFVATQPLDGKPCKTKVTIIGRSQKAEKEVTIRQEQIRNADTRSMSSGPSVSSGPSMCSGPKTKTVTYALALCELVDGGRNHQIRRHCAINGWPLLGDSEHYWDGGKGRRKRESERKSDQTCEQATKHAVKKPAGKNVRAKIQKTAEDYSTAKGPKAAEKFFLHAIHLELDLEAVREKLRSGGKNARKNATLEAMERGNCAGLLEDEREVTVESDDSKGHSKVPRKRVFSCFAAIPEEFVESVRKLGISIF
jgi:hypothetical protein